jgi:Helix-turn-helix domain of resolvase
MPYEPRGVGPHSVTSPHQSVGHDLPCGPSRFFGSMNTNEKGLHPQCTTNSPVLSGWGIPHPDVRSTTNNRLARVHMQTFLTLLAVGHRLFPDRSERRRRIAAGEKKAQVARTYGISRETLYQYLRAAHQTQTQTPTPTPTQQAE